MSFLQPKRVKDLPPLEPDSEDDKTPLKMKSNLKPSLINKFNGTKFIPKRVSELPTLESDSDEDKTQDNLNCAILDQSFIESPVKINNYEIPHNENKNTRNILNDTGYGDSFLINFNKLNVNDFKLLNNDNDIPKINLRKPFAFLERAKSEILQQDGLTEKQHLKLFFNELRAENNEIIVDKNSKESPNEIKQTHNENLNKTANNEIKIEEENENVKQKLLSLSQTNKENTREVNFKDKENIISPKKNDQLVLRSQNENQIKKILTDETPYKTCDNSNFATPQVSFQVHPRIRRFGLASTTQKKSVIENEFKSQKVLFQTPYAASRPPISTLGNNISLDLDDSAKTPILESVDSKKNCATVMKQSSEPIIKNEKLEDNEESSIREPQNKQNVIVINKKIYILVKKLGSGGSSIVYLAKRKDNDQFCAIKIVDLRADQSVFEGYLNETRLLARLQGNINVVNLYEYEHLSKECKLYMVMEKGDSDFHKILQSYNTHLPLYVLVNYWHQILQSVNYIHENGVIHSDLKPANFLMVNGRLKLIDFGIASNIAIDSTSIIKFSQAGTFNYISPEALIDISSDNSPMKNNQPKIKISTKSDVWSLGCILYLLLYKKTPFGQIKNIHAKVNAITNPKTVIDYPELPMFYPPMLKNMAKKCLIHQPKERISVAELLNYPFNMIIPLDKNENAL